MFVSRIQPCIRVQARKDQLGGEHSKQQIGVYNYSEPSTVPY